MADRMLLERLQPSLLDRLTDEEPDKAAETASNRVIDVGRLREIILRDLEWLLNTSNIESQHDLEGFPNVARSVLNYGVTDISGSISTTNRVFEIRQAIRTSVETFEQRILPETLEIDVRQEKVGTGAIISFDIRGELWAEPVPVDLYLRTAFDVTTGAVKLSKQG